MLYLEATQDVSTVADEPTTSFDQSSQSSTVYEEYYEEETFDSEFDSDEEFGRKRKGRKGGKGKVRIFYVRIYRNVLKRWRQSSGTKCDVP